MPFDVKFFIFILRVSKIISTPPGLYFLKIYTPVPLDPISFFYEICLITRALLKTANMLKFRKYFRKCYNPVHGNTYQRFVKMC